MELMKLEIITPSGVIFDAEVKQVTLPGSEGEFGVLPKHATVVSLLDTGVIVIEKEDGFIVDNLSYQQLFKKLNSILHNKTLTHYFINGVIYSYINGDD